MNIVAELEKLRRDRSEANPFGSLEEFEAWADSVRPCLAFSAPLYREFSQAVAAATVTARMGNQADSNTNVKNAIGIVNQGIVAARLVAAGPIPRAEAGERMESQRSSIKERFESHPVVFGLTLLLAGFLAGISFMVFLFPSFSNPVEPPLASASTPSSVECEIEGLPELTETHDKRIAALQQQLLQFEAQASDRLIISAYQERYLESANRVRADIEAENNALSIAINQLTVRCP